MFCGSAATFAGLRFFLDTAAAAFVFMALRGGADVVAVADVEVNVHALRESHLGAEFRVEDVAGVVGNAHQDRGAVVNRFKSAEHLTSGGSGENVAGRCGIHSAGTAERSTGRALVACAAAAGELNKPFRLAVFFSADRNTRVRKKHGIFIRVRQGQKTSACDGFINQRIKIVVNLFQKPFSIQDRQKGRLQSESVINCGVSADEIVDAVRTALSDAHRQLCRSVVSPYGDGHAAERTARKAVETVMDGGIDLKKKFYDMST